MPAILYKIPGRGGQFSGQDLRFDYKEFQFGLNLQFDLLTIQTLQKFGLAF